MKEVGQERRTGSPGGLKMTFIFTARQKCIESLDTYSSPQRGG
jgi:hypothetical protein